MPSIGEAYLGHRAQLAIRLTLAVLFIAALVVIYVDMTMDRGPYMVLRSPLPVEQPEMKVLMITPMGIDSAADARSYASMYFPEFADAEFSDDGDGSYDAESEEALIVVYASGRIQYTPRDGDAGMPIDSLPLEVAANVSEGFIRAHGGLEPYEEYQRHTVGSVDDDGNILEIKARSFYYHRRYDGYWVLGDDGLGTMVLAGTRAVSLSRTALVLNASSETRQVISAHAAWNALVESMDGGDRSNRVSVTSVELCYYVVDSREDGPAIFPAWRFVDPDLDYFVNALTGEVLSGGYRSK